MVYPVSNSSEEKKPKTVGVDANLARHLNFIFAPGKEGNTERVKQWVTKHPTSGRPVIKKIGVLGSLGPAELRTFLVLCKLRQESKDQDVIFSLQGTAKLAQLDWHGRAGGTRRGKPRTTKNGRAIQNKSTAESLRNALMHLRGGLLILTNVYFDPEKGEFITAEGVTILDKLRVVQHTPVDQQTGELDHAAVTIQSLFRFNPMIEKAITGGVLKPIVLDALLSIDKRATAAVYAYLHLDRKLYKRAHWIEAGATLLPAIGLTGNYRRPAERKRVLDTIAKHLNGLAISTGFIRVTVTKRAGDWCLSATKLTRAALAEPRPSRHPALEVEGDRTPHSPRAHYDQHRTDVHPEPVGDCPDCRTVASLLKVGILKHAAPVEQPAAIAVDTDASPDTAPQQTAPLAAEQLDPHAIAAHLMPRTHLPAVEAVTPSAPEQSDPTPDAGARPPGTAPGEVPTA